MSNACMDGKRGIKDSMSALNPITPERESRSQLANNALDPQYDYLAYLSSMYLLSTSYSARMLDRYERIACLRTPLLSTFFISNDDQKSTSHGDGISWHPISSDSHSFIHAHSPALSRDFDHLSHIG